MVKKTEWYGGELCSGCEPSSLLLKGIKSVDMVGPPNNSGFGSNVAGVCVSAPGRPTAPGERPG